ncbi:hypothetical protein L6452_31042 [Arctium lappa]|uniref:Uncharacterized protein n=1 Tax=Arctium lappa TaxID=4217 RepID=A0ACB8ZKA5_ARCLA|nr:hypothetical protein L6452_31042 [Arctium lappa]
MTSRSSILYHPTYNILRFLTSQPKAKHVYVINTIGQDGADLTSSGARRFLKSSGARRFLNIQELEDLSNLQEPEDLSNLQEPEDFSHLQKNEDFSPMLTSQQFKTKSPQDKRYTLYHVEDLCPSLAQQASHALNA